MDSVGDVTDGNGVLGMAGIESFPHRAGYFAVQRESIERRASRKARSCRTPRGAGVLAAERHQAVVCEAKLSGERPKVFIHHGRRKAVMTSARRAS
jgi:hypothetical protein